MQTKSFMQHNTKKINNNPQSIKKTTKIDDKVLDKVVKAYNASNTDLLYDEEKMSVFRVLLFANDPNDIKAIKDLINNRSTILSYDNDALYDYNNLANILYDYDNLISISDDIALKSEYHKYAKSLAKFNMLENEISNLENKSEELRELIENDDWFENFYQQGNHEDYGWQNAKAQRKELERQLRPKRTELRDVKEGLDTVAKFVLSFKTVEYKSALKEQQKIVDAVKEVRRNKVLDTRDKRQISKSIFKYMNSYKSNDKIFDKSSLEKLLSEQQTWGKYFADIAINIGNIAKSNSTKFETYKKENRNFKSSMESLQSIITGPNKSFRDKIMTEQSSVPGAEIQKSII